MRIYRLTRPVGAVLFDIDGTLYTKPDYVRYQVDVLIEELARISGRGVEDLRQDIENTRRSLAAAEGRAGTSLGNAMAAMGVDIATSVAWRNRLIDPTRFLEPDTALAAALGALADGGIALAAVTNNPHALGRATLRALGVEGYFGAVVGLDDTMQSKPARAPYELAARILKREHERCLSVGDRYDVDLALPLELGMGAILVDGVEDLYGLPAVVLGRATA
jgi:phosphoglycolate phosphatase/putative hydrolase of the HAD superfamily